MELNDAFAPQRRYARWLRWSTRVATILLVAACVVYVSGLIPPHVPIARLPELWGLTASKFLVAEGLRPGWSWAGQLPQGDMLVLAAIATLISASILCLAAIAPIFLRRGERLFVAMCILQIAVLLVAASGWISR